MKNKSVLYFLITIIIIIIFIKYNVNTQNTFKEQQNFLKIDQLIEEYKLNYSVSNFDIPEPYYFRFCSEQNNDLETLKKEISIIKDRPYEEDIYDCSEKSAYLEWLLQNNCYDAYILADYKMKHSWTRVYINGVPIDIETTPKITIDNLPIRINGFEVYDTIYTTFNMSRKLDKKNPEKYLDDWDWWKKR